MFKNFNFGQDIQKWVNLFQNNVFSIVNQGGGDFSDKVNIHRGCRQGDPISSYTFILCVEVLANHIRNNKSINGMSVNKKELIDVSQFVDDTTVILDGSEHSLSSAPETISILGKHSGLKINIDTTQVVWIGSKKFLQTKKCVVTIILNKGLPVLVYVRARLQC